MGSQSTGDIENVIQGDSAPEGYTATGGIPIEHRREMYRAAISGDWEAAEKLLGKYPELARTPISDEGHTALHMSALAKRTKFVTEIVKKMSESDMLLTEKYGGSALAFAAMGGSVEIADMMLSKNPNLITFGKVIPLNLAFAYKKKEMIWYLYKRTPDEGLSTEQWSDALRATIIIDMFDLASKILTTKIKDDAKLEDIMEWLGLLARKDGLYNQSTDARITKVIAHLPWFSRAFKKPSMCRNALLLAQMLWDEFRKRKTSNREMLLKDPPILHDAARMGNIGFITVITRSDPQLIFTSDKKEHWIFHAAISERQADVFSLAYQIEPVFQMLSKIQDECGNNMLHLVAKLAPPHRLSMISGAALQLQSELLWFKRVEKLVSPLCPEMKNNDGFLPRELFSKEHKDLFKEGEQWIKDTSNYSMVVATLVATMAFAAAITVPGGYNGDTGIPIFFNSNWFRVFMVSNAVAMFCSIASIIVFLSLLVSRYREDDFLVLLPTELMLGFLTLFTSLVGTLFSFASAYYLGDQHNASASRWILVSACVLLIVLFVFQHYKLFIDTIISAYWSRFMFRQSKHKLY